jgi:hypothetical protein
MQVMGLERRSRETLTTVSHALSEFEHFIYQIAVTAVS